MYEKQFSLYIDNIIARIDMQEDAFRRDENIPERLFEIYDEQKAGLSALKEKFGSVVSPSQIESVAG